ncbi:MAG: ParB/RepB/Spo0J family partition protein [Candidatus Dormibacteria bacterium]
MPGETPRPAPLRRRGLGRGLDALLGPLPGAETGAPETRAGDEETVLLELPVGAIDPSPEQPRTAFDDAALDELASSIRTHGLLHPVVVERKGERFRLVAGERRWRATRRAGLATIAAIVRPASESARHMLEVALTENLVRADLSPLEEAAAYARLADTFGLSHEAIAMRLGRSRPAISNTIRLLTLPAALQRAVAAGELSAGHARALLALPDPEAREAMGRRAIDEGWSVRRTEQAVAASSATPPATAAGPPSRPSPSPDDEALRRGLEAALGLPVRLERRGRGGRIVVEFTGDEDLDGLYQRLGAPPL